MVQEAPPPPLSAGIEADLAVVEANFQHTLLRAVKTWAIRWAIGFGIIWATTALGGGFGWLWGVGSIAALLSLAFAVAAPWLLRKRLRQTAAKRPHRAQSRDLS